ncbi:MAG TPA: Gfo/Idh/MocA family oxidoreductase [Thermomicrobiales bacterium]|nr:Gfo/Idh/MocA family oxidoreductase [Thermomicrobiales bacterium]
MTTRPTGIGVIGAGFISGIYLTNLTTRWEHVRVVGIADLVPERAQARAAEFGIAALTIAELLAHPGIDIVLNLTIPAAHADVCEQVIAAGKSVYTEKPLALSRDQGRHVLDAAHERGLQVGCAPDTFLGAGLQTVRRLLDEGIVGEPVAFRARMTTHGHESWHPDPAFYYQPGAGPMLDMGPYYITAIVALLGPVRRVSAMARATWPQRTITSQPKYGELIEVNTPSHIEANLELESGVPGTLMTSFDLWDTEHCSFVIYGSEGSIRLPDPNTFGGPIRVLKAGESTWADVPLDHGYATNSRGIGIADMAKSMQVGEPIRASGALGLHALDVMLATLDSAEQGRHIAIASTVERPASLGPVSPEDVAPTHTMTYRGETLG